MGKAKMIGQFRACLPNARADMRRTKAWKRSREYSDRHEDIMQEKWEKKLMLETEKEKEKGNADH